MKPNFYSRGSLRGAVKILLFSFFSTFFGSAVYAQDSSKNVMPVNAYYLAKDLYKFSKLAKPKITKKDSDFADEILAKLYYYTGTDSSEYLQDLLRNSDRLKNIFTSLETKSQFVQEEEKIKKILSLNAPAKSDINEHQQKNNKNQDDLTALEKMNQVIDGIHNEQLSDSITVSKKDYQKKIESLNGFKFKNENKDNIKISYQYFQHFLDSVRTKRIEIDTRSIALFDSLRKENPGQLGVSSIEPRASSTLDFQRTYEKVQSQNAQITISLLESSSGSISGWKMPSEDEMIDAVATYIASRVKQETVLWFFDQMRSNTERYDLIMTAFPETMKLLQSSEVFDAPNIGSAWKYALSKDFIRLPKNILTSEWLDKRIPEDEKKYLDLAKISWEISSMIDNRLSYRDILKQLYLDRKLYDEREISDLPDTVISYLYSISNELYVVVNKQSIRNLTYEELISMPSGQLEIMLELLEVKYGKVIRHFLLGSDTTQIDNRYKQLFANWLGNSLLALAQFDKILQQIDQSKKGSNVALFDGYNTWKLISQVVESSIPKEKKKQYQRYVDRANDAFEVYHLLSEKNYAGAVSKTLALVDSLIYNEYLIVDTNLYRKNNSFFIPLHSRPNSSGTYCIDIRDLDKYFVERRAQPKKFPKIARHLEKGCIEVIAPTDGIVDTIVDKFYFNMSQNVLMAKLKDSEHCWEKCRINRFFDKMNNCALNEIIKEYKKWGGHKIGNGSKIQFPIHSIAAQALISSDKKAMQMIMKLASFLNDVSQSDNEKELKKVIESYALPPGSYKQKRNAWHSITLNAFAGPYCGYETAKLFRAKVNDTLYSFGGSYGISAPIGITYTKTFGKKIFHTSRLTSASQNNPDLITIKRKNLRVRSNFSLSLSLTVVDIGAVVSYRLNHNDKVLDQSFKWEQFISPGLHVGIAIPKTPLIAQFGYQYTPKIRRLDADGYADKQIGMWRSYVGVFFDIPLVNLWMKTRSVKFE